MVIEEFGPRVANVWNHLRTTTRNLVENAWQSAGSASAQQVPRPAPYDPHADRELSQLLAALDDHAQQTESSSGREGARESRRLADACANVLSQQTQSAEVFAQLIERAHHRNNYAQVDALAALLPERLPPRELCELARANKVIVRALAHEALAQLPTSLLAAGLPDPADAVIARQALVRQGTGVGPQDGPPAFWEAVDEFVENIC